MIANCFHAISEGLEEIRKRCKIYIIYWGRWFWLGYGLGDPGWDEGNKHIGTKGYFKS